MNFNRRLHDIAALRKDLGFGCCRDTDLISEDRVQESAVFSLFSRPSYSGSPERPRLQGAAVTQISSWKTGRRRALFFFFRRTPASGSCALFSSAHTPGKTRR